MISQHCNTHPLLRNRGQRRGGRRAGRRGDAISQAREFAKAIQPTGLVLTKLDGTAKGGIVFALSREFGLPIRYVGLGEKAEDLREFDATAFVDAIFAETSE